MRRHTIDTTYTPHTLLLKRQWSFRDLMWKTVPHCITIKKESIKEIILGCYTWNSCVSLPFPLTAFSRLSHELRSDKPELWTREIAKIFKSAKYCPCTYEHRTSTTHNRGKDNDALDHTFSFSIYNNPNFVKAYRVLSLYREEYKSMFFHVYQKQPSDERPLVTQYAWEQIPSTLKLLKSISL